MVINILLIRNFSHFAEGPTTHDQPTYASVPGIKVYGMVCVSKSDTLAIDAHMKRKIRVLNGNRESTSTDGTNVIFVISIPRQLVLHDHVLST